MSPVIDRHDIRVLHAEATEALAAMPDASVDVIITDPPYGLSEMSTKRVLAAVAAWSAGDLGFVPDGRGFMSKEWDRFVPPPAVWVECLRVLKPGGWMLCFSGQRTVDLMGLSIRFAGFQVLDSISWVFGSGMPKVGDVSKMMRKAGIADEIAQQFEDFSPALKPGQEPIILARRPIEGTLVANLAEHGTGAFNIGSTRVAVAGERPGRESHGVDTPGKSTYGSGGPGGGSSKIEPTTLGRWPTNLVLSHDDECRNLGVTEVPSNSHHPARRGPGGISTSGHSGQTDLDERTLSSETVEDWDCTPTCPVGDVDNQSGNVGAAAAVKRGYSGESRGVYGDFAQSGDDGATFRGDSGGASRFFPTFEHEPDLLDAEAFVLDLIESARRRYDGASRSEMRYSAKSKGKERPIGDDGTKHPTIKPLGLMRWLVRLATPPGGTILDPFVGSGTTLEAALLEGVPAIGIEGHEPYLALISKRLDRSAPSDDAMSVATMRGRDQVSGSRQGASLEKGV
jgi:DNA modification methylase